jgi:hypothetical protein
MAAIGILLGFVLAVLFGAGVLALLRPIARRGAALFYLAWVWAGILGMIALSVGPALVGQPGALSRTSDVPSVADVLLQSVVLGTIFGLAGASGWRRHAGGAVSPSASAAGWEVRDVARILALEAEGRPAGELRQAARAIRQTARRSGQPLPSELTDFVSRHLRSGV